MTHSYYKKAAIFQGKVTPLDNALSNRKGEITSEGFHMQEMTRLSTRIDWRSLSTFQKSVSDRKELKKRKAKASFDNLMVPFHLLKNNK